MAVLWPGSSVVERRFEAPGVGGSSPPRATYQQRVEELLTQRLGGQQGPPVATATTMLDEGYSIMEAAYAVSVLHKVSPPAAAAVAVGAKHQSSR